MDRPIEPIHGPGKPIHVLPPPPLVDMVTLARSIARGPPALDLWPTVVDRACPHWIHTEEGWFGPRELDPLPRRWFRKAGANLHNWSLCAPPLWAWCITPPPREKMRPGPWLCRASTATWSGHHRKATPHIHTTTLHLRVHEAAPCLLLTVLKYQI